MTNYLLALKDIESEIEMISSDSIPKLEGYHLNRAKNRLDGAL